MYNVHTIESAPKDSKPVLEKLKESVGVIPNLAATMSESPTLINSFVTLRNIYGSGSFTPLEREVMSITNAVVNDCRYCVAAHSTFAVQAGVSEDVLKALRAGKLPEDSRLRALSDFARKVTVNRGQMTEADLQAFLEAGYTKAQALEVIVGAAFSVLANYSNHFTNAPVDEFFQSQKWEGLG